MSFLQQNSEWFENFEKNWPDRPLGDDEQEKVATFLKAKSKQQALLIRSFLFSIGLSLSFGKILNIAFNWAVGIYANQLPMMLIRIFDGISAIAFLLSTIYIRPGYLRDSNLSFWILSVITSIGLFLFLLIFYSSVVLLLWFCVGNLLFSLLCLMVDLETKKSITSTENIKNYFYHHKTV